MRDLTLPLSEELRDRLQAIADRTGRSLEECAQIALGEFVLHWEIHLKDVEDLDDERPFLRAVNE